MKRVYIALLLSILAGILNRMPFLLPDFVIAEFVVMGLQWLALGIIIPFLSSRAKPALKTVLFIQLALVPLFIFLFSAKPEAVLLTGVFAILPGLFYRFKDERPASMDKRVHFTWQQHHVQMSR